jgi:hypothetical protein
VNLPLRHHRARAGCHHHHAPHSRLEKEVVMGPPPAKEEGEGTEVTNAVAAPWPTLATDPPPGLYHRVLYLQVRSPWSTRLSHVSSSSRRHLHCGDSRPPCCLPGAWGRGGGKEELWPGCHRIRARRYLDSILGHASTEERRCRRPPRHGWI